MVPPHDPVPGAIWNYAIEILYNPILALTKSSILIFLLRLFGQKPGVRRFIIWVNAANILNMVAILTASIFQCLPIEKNWDPSLPGSCVDRRALFTTSSSINILTDLLVLGLPLKILSGLKIRKQTKIALMFVFMLGSVVTIVGVVRLVLLVQGLFMLIELPDPTANIGFVTSAIETNLFLITASAPALRPLLRVWFPRLFGGRTGRMDLGGGGGGGGGGGAGAGGPGGAQTRQADVTIGGTTVAGTTRLTRMKSQVTAPHGNQSPVSFSDEALAFHGIVRRSDVIVQYDSRLEDLEMGEERRAEKWV